MKHPTTRRCVALALALACTVACGTAAAAWFGDTVKGNGTIRQQDRTPGRFDSIELSLPAQVEVRLGATDSVSIETDENILPLVETAIEDGALQLRPVKRGLSFDTRTLKIVVSAREIRRLAIGGSGAINAPSLKAPRLKLEVGGSGAITAGQLQSDSVDAEIGGSGNIKLAGAARKFTVAIGGSGELRAPQLRADDVSVSIGGSGNATVWAVSGLRTAIAGSGDVSYYGDPRITSSVAGSGSVKRLGAVPH